jgi:Anti-sigma-K factor rskA
MDHAEVRELLELAAAEPGGYERLMAGDTVESSAVAGHLAGCPACTAEAEAIRRAAVVIRQVVRETPPADLRDRTLAAVAALGRQRGPTEAASAIEAPTPNQAASRIEAVSAIEPAIRRPIVSIRRAAGSGRPSLGWLAAAAAAVLIAVGATGAVVTSQKDAQLAARARANAALAENAVDLARVSEWTLRVGSQPGAKWVALASTTGSSPAATLLFDRQTRNLVVVGSGLTPPGGGRQYRCWVEIAGSRQPVGQMFFAGDVSYWVGKVQVLDRVAPGSRFGISLVASDGTAIGDPVLTGTF